MKSKLAKKAGFSMNRIDEDTILIKPVPRQKLTGKKKSKFNKRVSTVELHIFSKDYLKRLQNIETKIHNRKIKNKDSIKNSIRFVGKLITE